MLSQNYWRYTFCDPSIEDDEKLRRLELFSDDLVGFQSDMSQGKAPTPLQEEFYRRCYDIDRLHPAHLQYTPEAERYMEALNRVAEGMFGFLARQKEMQMWMPAI
ncbi:MAG: hypothetical protein CL565_02145 [Alphaproteobacteria bacterium]|nr:hypothetical protein [Alphaproteobacteria bacterium]